tara:strand:- start:110 stop:514 length:405 start_codon:yes stop_codon:yes gene_type:complete
MPRTKLFTDEQLEQALMQCCGILSTAAKKLKVNRSAVSQRISKSKKLQEVVRQAKAQALDLAESELLFRLKDRKHPNTQMNAIMYYLNNQGESRGYTPNKKHDRTEDTSTEDLKRLSNLFRKAYDEKPKNEPSD